MKRNTIYLIAIAIFLFSCGDPEKNNNNEKENKKAPENEQVEVEKEIPNTFKDSRDGKIYKIAKIGDNVWFTENLAYKPSSGKFWAYENKEANVEKYGYLYDWETSQNVAPEGWHLPTKKEFEILLKHYGDKPYKALTKDEAGFAVVFGGWYFEESGFNKENTEVGFWSATENENDKLDAWNCIINVTFEQASMNFRRKYYGASIRLIRD